METVHLNHTVQKAFSDIFTLGYCDCYITMHTYMQGSQEQQINKVNNQNTKGQN